MNIIPKKTLMACLVIAISSTAYAKDEYLYQIATERCQNLTHFHKDYMYKLALTKDNTTYNKTLQSYYKDFGELSNTSTEEARKHKAIKEVVGLASWMREEAPDYELRKATIQHPKMQASLSNIFKDYQNNCLKHIPSVIAEIEQEWAEKERIAEKEREREKIEARTRPMSEEERLLNHFGIETSNGQIVNPNEAKDQIIGMLGILAIMAGSGSDSDSDSSSKSSSSIWDNF